MGLARGAHTFSSYQFVTRDIKICNMVVFPLINKIL